MFLNFRDIKLENILLGKDGHVKITDFGLSKLENELPDENANDQIVGTFEYMAPEVVTGQKHSFAADWWAFGVVLYEMLTGLHPFYVDDHEELYDRILSMEVEYPEYASMDALDLLSKLFIRKPSERLGYGPLGGHDVQRHAFFSSIDFNKLFDKNIEPPFKPDVTDDFDVSYFDDDFTNQAPVLTPSGTRSMINLSKQAFDNFSFVRESIYLNPTREA